MSGKAVAQCEVDVRNDTDEIQFTPTKKNLELIRKHFRDGKIPSLNSNLNDSLEEEDDDTASEFEKKLRRMIENKGRNQSEFVPPKPVLQRSKFEPPRP